MRCPRGRSRSSTSWVASSSLTRPTASSRTQREAHAIAALPLDEESALHLSRLPVLHRDPFDRMLVCQAIVHGLTILTPDPLIAQYPARTTW